MDAIELQPIAREKRQGKIGRLRCENFKIQLSGGTNSQGEDVMHPAILSIAWDETGRVHEVVIEGRGKTGHGMNLMMHDLSIMISRVIQGRDPMTGEPF